MDSLLQHYEGQTKKIYIKLKHAYSRLIFDNNILQYQCILCKTSLYILTYSKKCDLGSPIQSTMQILCRSLPAQHKIYNTKLIYCLMYCKGIISSLYSELVVQSSAGARLQHAVRAAQPRVRGLLLPGHQPRHQPRHNLQHNIRAAPHGDNIRAANHGPYEGS